MKAILLVPLVVGDIEFDVETEVTQVTFNGASWNGLIIPTGVSFKSKRFRVTVEALDVSARLESEP